MNLTLPLISLKQANRFVLKRQHLLEPCQDPVQATRDACGLQAQVPSSPALSLRVRVAGFSLADYDKLMEQERTLVRTWAMRGTVHVLPSAQLQIYTRIYANPDGLSPRAKDGLRLLEGGPKTRNQLAALAVSELGYSQEDAKEMFGPWGGILSTIARAAQSVHMPAPGADVPFVRTVDWLGPQPDPAPVQALEDALLVDYFRGYGPASLKDFRHFTNFRAERLKAIWARAQNRLAEVKLEGTKDRYYVLAEDLPALLNITGDEQAPVQLLPRFDSLVLVHGEKARFLDEDRRRHVFGAGAQVEATVLIDGRVAGVWRMARTAKGMRFHFNPFGDQPTEGVEAEARRLAAWYGLDLLAFEVKAEGPQARVAARKERIESQAGQVKPPRLLVQDAYREPLREGSLVHVPALPGLAAPPEQLEAAAQAYLTWLVEHRLARPPLDPGKLLVREIGAKVAAINPRPGRQTTALLDSDLVPMKDDDLRRAGRILRALAKAIKPTRKHAEMFGWFMNRCATAYRKAGPEQLVEVTGELISVLQRIAPEHRGRVVDMAGEPWTPRKVVRRAIQYLRDESGQTW